MLGTSLKASMFCRRSHLAIPSRQPWVRGKTSPVAMSATTSALLIGPFCVPLTNTYHSAASKGAAACAEALRSALISAKLATRVASTGSAGSLRAEFGGIDKTGAIAISSTGGWQNWTNVSRAVSLSAGQQIMRIFAVGGDFNLNYIALSSGVTPTPTNTPVPPGGYVPAFCGNYPPAIVAGSWQSSVVWYANEPEAFVRLDESRQSFEGALRNYVTAMVGRYRGIASGWDVVNEPIKDDGTGPRESLWSRRLGQVGHFRVAYEAARAADPDVPLFTNDYHLESKPAKLASYMRLIEQLLREGVPLSGIGCQTHLTADLPAGAITADTGCPPASAAM